MNEDFKPLKPKNSIGTFKVSHVEEKEEKEDKGYEQISIFDDLGD